MGIDRDDHALHRQLQTLGDRLDDADVRLVGNQPIDLVLRDVVAASVSVTSAPSVLTATL
jgi:hypothetical protein